MPVSGAICCVFDFQGPHMTILAEVTDGPLVEAVTVRAPDRVGNGDDQALQPPGLVPPRALLDRLGTRQGTLPPDSTPIDITSATPEIKVENGFSNPFVSRAAVPDSTMLRDRIDAGSSPTPSIYP